MKLVVSRVRSAKAPWADEACAEWARRIARYLPFDEKEIRAGSGEDDARALLEGLPARGLLVVLDERGDRLTSEGFAALIDLAAREAASHLVFAVGGAHGHTPAVRERAWRVVRMSDLVLAHAVARVVLMEQLYRACTIRAGEPYHHAG